MTAVCSLQDYRHEVIIVIYFTHFLYAGKNKCFRAWDRARFSVNSDDSVVISYYEAWSMQTKSNSPLLSCRLRIWCLWLTLLNSRSNYQWDMWLTRNPGQSENKETGLGRIRHRVWHEENRGNCCASFESPKRPPRNLLWYNEAVTLECLLFKLEIGYWQPW